MPSLIALLVLCSTVLFSVSCSSPSKPSKPAEPVPQVSKPKQENSSDLLWSEAQERKSRLSDIRYTLKVDLMSATSKEVEASYSGDLSIRFQLKDATKDLRLDFFEGEIKWLAVNGKPLPLTFKKPYWIELPASSLAEGPNEVRIEYTQKYSRTGEGLHRFVDPVDQKVYLYTQFETFDANRFLPCFDQPDLRSTFNLTVQAPKNFQVVSSSKEISKIDSGEGTLWTFEPSASISTYLFSLHAGPYFVFNDSYKRADGSVLPLRIMLRPGLKNFIKEREWFQTTKDGIAFYESYFGARYPFSKLDQLVVPEFNAGGMENVGAITYTENVLPRSVLTRKARRGISSLQLHEIAHMWFGDLVTMVWWNNLWLNESFATYMSALAQSEATEFKEVWQSFGGHVKSKAYIEDAMTTTHPIEAPIHTVKEAMTNFDGITYNKGASVIQQLNYYMTSEAFREGIRTYFKTYSFQNTTLPEYISSLQKHTKKDLNHWANRWLRQSGTDTASVSYQCDGDRLDALNVKLETTPGRLPRPQSMEVALYQKVGKKLVVKSKLRADFEGRTSPQVLTMRGDWDCPEFVYPNHDDHDFVAVKFDSKSLGSLKAGISKIGDPLTRSLAWNDLWRMVRDTELPLKEYVEIVRNNFANENDEIILQQVLATILRPNGSILSYWPTGTETSKAERAKFVTEMESEFLRRLKSSRSGSDDEKLWYDAFADIAETPAATEQLYKWYAAGRVSPNFQLDLERKWDLSKTLTRFGHPRAGDVLMEMKKADSTDRGIKAALAVEASNPALQAKKKWVHEFTSTTLTPSRSLIEAEAVLSSLFPLEQREAKLNFSKDFFSYLEKNRASEDRSRVGAVLRSLTPLDCEASNSQALKQKVIAYPDMNPTFRKRLLMSLEEDERCQRVRVQSRL